MYGVSDLVEPMPVSRYRLSQYSLPFGPMLRRSIVGFFRGSIPDLHVPLSTLRLNDCSFLRRLAASLVR